MENEKGFTGRQLACIAANHECTALYFGGIKAADNLPAHINSYPTFFIVNSDLAWQKGSHWLLLVFSSPRLSIYYDPLGKRPRQYSVHIERFLQQHSESHYLANTARYQPACSCLCGLYCLMIADKICQGQSFATALQSFRPQKLEANDEIVYEYYKNHLLKRPATRS